MIVFYVIAMIIFVVLAHHASEENNKFFEIVMIIGCALSVVLILCASIDIIERVKIQGDLAMRDNPELRKLLESEYPQKNNETRLEYYTRLKPKYTKFLKYIKEDAK